MLYKSDLPIRKALCESTSFEDKHSLCSPPGPAELASLFDLIVGKALWNRTEHDLELRREVWVWLWIEPVELVGDTFSFLCAIPMMR